MVARIVALFECVIEAQRPRVENFCPVGLLCDQEALTRLMPHHQWHALNLCPGMLTMTIMR